MSFSAVAALTALLVAVSPGSKAKGQGGGGPGFGRHVAGAYLVDVTAGSTVVLRAIGALSATGEVSLVDSGDFPGPAGDPFDGTAALGEWRRTGPRDVTVRTISFSHDPSGGGAAVAYVVSEIVLNFQPGFDSFTLALAQTTVPIAADPLDPNLALPPPMLTGTGRRIQ